MSSKFQIRNSGPSGLIPALLSSILLLCLVLLNGCATQPPRRSFPEFSTLPPHPALPDPLIMLDGRQVTTRAQWLKERRPELKALFQHYMYGTIPHKPATMQAKLLGEHHDFLGG